ncbi:MAG: class I SAM-dependent methyltransferase [Clostridia bacterium]|nr:class I SAM-dependent methyltransferase [Clostridia bacterium]
MSQFSHLAACYDLLIEQSVYDNFCKRITALLCGAGICDGLLLELCCGTGSLTRLLSQQGYEMIGCDISPEMLNVAREKCADLSVPPVLICQPADELDLYGTVRGAVCCLDSVNYFTDLRELKRVFSRVSLFLEPGGLFLFDVKSRELFSRLCGTSSIQETENYFCAWQYGFDASSGRGMHQVDIFKKSSDKYRRFTEIHEQRCYSMETLKNALLDAGFSKCDVYEGFTAKRARQEAGRLLFAARK